MTDPAPDTTPTGDQPPPDVDGGKPDTDWQAEAKKWEKRAKDNHARLKDLEPKVTEWEQARQASKTAEERAAEELASLREEAGTWRARAVLSRVEALAAAEFADPSDALTAVDPDDYLGPDGQIDEKALTADLAELLERKPHWRRQGTTGPVPPPSFDGGARTTAPAPVSMTGLIRKAAGRA